MKISKRSNDVYHSLFYNPRYWNSKILSVRLSSDHMKYNFTISNDWYGILVDNWLWSEMNTKRKEKMKYKNICNIKRKNGYETEYKYFMTIEN